MSRAIQSPFVDAESFTHDEGPAAQRSAAPAVESFGEEPERAYEQFEDLRELWTRSTDDEQENLENASDATTAESEMAFEEETNTACTDSGFGIVGTDDRRQVTNPLEIPFRWVCQLWVRREDSNGKVTETGGTGVLISPRHVLTVAHLVRTAEQNDKGHWITSQATYIRVSPARDGNDRPLGTHDVKLPAQIAPDWDPIRKPHGYDYALLTLEKPIGDEAFKRLSGARLCYWGSRACGAGTTLRRVPPGPLNGRTAITAGYPKDKGKTTPYVTRGQIAGANFRSRIMSISADACQGQSGSPIWINIDREHCMVGMMVAVARGTNVALRVTDEFCAQLRTWMKGASDVCAPRAAVQPELESEPRYARCRCGHEASAQAESDNFDRSEFELDTPDDLETELDSEDSEGELIATTEYQQEYGGDLESGRDWDESSELENSDDHAALDREAGLDQETMWESEAATADRDFELLSAEIAELLPPRVIPPDIDRELVAHETPPLPKGLYAFEHWVTPMKRDEVTASWIRDGADRKLEPLDPGFFDASGELKVSPLDDGLKDLLTKNTDFNRHLSRDAVRDRKAKPGDRIRVALVDLTGRKILEPEFAGWGSTVPVDGASCLKLAPLYAAFQLRNDLKHIASAEKITKTAELVRVMTQRWRGVAGAPKLDQFLYRMTNPPDLEFTAEIDEAVDNIISQKKANYAAKVLIDVIGYPYIASLMWQSGLRHPTRGGMWVTISYEGGAPWSNAPKLLPAPVFGRNATALSLATFFTLLAQDRLARSGLPRTIKTTLSTASWFRPALPTASIASKVGLYLRCTSWGPKMKGGQPVVVNGQPVQECKRSIATHVHEAGLIENGPVRYAVAILTVGIPTGASLLETLVGKLDGLIRRNNP